MSRAPQPQLRPLLTTLDLTVRTYDIDFANIVHNRVYIRWLEDLRQQILEPYLPIAKMFADGYSPILTHTEIDYRQPVRFGDRVVGLMWVEDLSRTRWTVEAEILKEETVAASALQSGYFADLDSLRPVRIPQTLRSLWNEQRANDTDSQPGAL